MYNHSPHQYLCPFCLVSQGTENEHVITKQQDIVYQDDTLIAFVSPQWWPKNQGHIIIIPRQHSENLYNIDDVILGKLYAFAKEAAIALKVTYGCDGTSMRQHNEPAGGQEVWHTHMHMFPRYENDGLYENDDKKYFVSPEERLPYAVKLRTYFAGSRATLAISHTFSDYRCPICPAVKGIENGDTLIKQSDIIYRDTHVTAFISSFFKEKNPGHVIIVPNQHYENVYALPEDVSTHIQCLAKRIAFGLKMSYHCDGVSTAQHNEPAGDQQAFHYHFHVFPRYDGDELYKHIHEKIEPTSEDRAVYANKLKKFLHS